MADETQAACRSSEGQTGLLELVRVNSEYFDKLVDLIPPRFYLPANDDAEKPWVFGMTKKQRLAARRKTKENLKKARRDRLDPEKNLTTSQLLQQRGTNAKPPSESDDKADVNDAAARPQDVTERAKTSLELRERLHKKIEAIRSQRLVNEAKDWQKESKKVSRKRKKPEEASSKTAEENAPSKRPKQVQSAEPVVDLEFGRVKLDSQKRLPNRKNKEKLLEEATKLQKKIMDPEQGKEIGTKHSWSAAVSRASGEKVFDNPKLLKQSLKRDQQRREKSTRKWKDRHDTEAQKAEEKQQTRSQHLKERGDARKARAIAKREKKLMRPGFEGRKAGFLNEAKTK